MKIVFATVTAVALATTAMAGGNNNQNGPQFGGGGDATAIAGAAAGASASNTNRINNRNNNTNTNYNSATQGQLQGQLQGQAQGQLQGQGQNQSANNRNIINHEAAASSAIAGAVAPAGNCGVGLGLGGSEIYGSVSLGVTWQNVPCVVRMEAAQLMGMGLRDAALLHLASYHKRMGKSLERAGVVQKAAAPTTSTRSVAPVTAPVQSVSYTSCKMDDGKIRVGVARGASDEVKARAVSQCRSALK